MTILNTGLKGLTLINPYNAELFLKFKPWRPKGFFQFEIIINVLVSSFRLNTYVMVLRLLEIFFTLTVR